MICPFCGRDMEEAYIQSSQQIYLNPGNKPRTIASGDLSTKTLTGFSLTKAPFVRAYYCKNCAKAIIDLKENGPYPNEKSLRKTSFRR